MSTAACLPQAATGSFTTVVNNGVVMPEGSGLPFNSYNQPSIASNGLVILRARSKGCDCGDDASVPAAEAAPGPVHGVYFACGHSVKIADRSSVVPQPNNTGVEFNEFPSFPRIDGVSKMAAFRGNSPPVWGYDGSGQDEKVGTTGVFMARLHGTLFNGLNQCAEVPGFSHMQVPGASVPNLKFEVFPGAPSPVGDVVTFKGNYTDQNLKKTGVYYRDTRADQGKAPIQLVANSDTLIPGQPEGGVKFGSTAPPSAAKGKMVFVGWDDENHPALGGIYSAPLKPNPPLTTLVKIGDPVPGEAAQFNQLGEGLSFDGRYVGFWAAWGTQTNTITLMCPTKGNKERNAYCLSQYPDGFTTSEPVHQGFFVYDSNSRKLTMVAQTGNDGFSDFIYWNFSGKVPGGSEGDNGEPARWRSAEFAAVSAYHGSFGLAFKATKDSAVQGIYFTSGPNPSLSTHRTIIDTTLDAQQVDPEAPAGLRVTSIGIERDGFRAPFLAFTASMANTEPSWGGIYVTRP